MSTAHDRPKETAIVFGPGFDQKVYQAVIDHPTPRISGWACVGEDPELFDPVDEEELGWAQSVCDRCPVRKICGELGINRNEWGVWGGTLLEAGKPLATPRRVGRPVSKRSENSAA
jgi:hypothetical protein